MYNNELPKSSELPSPQRLIKSTVIALLAALAILYAVVLPAEYGMDPTGIGRVLGLAQMGEIKEELAEEAKSDRQRDLEQQNSSDPNQSSALEAVTGFFIPSAYAHDEGHDNEDADGSITNPSPNRIADIAPTVVKLPPGEYIEVKFQMKEGVQMAYEWSVVDGLVNYDLHGDGDGSKSVSYDKGRGSEGASGTFTAEFDGHHGWFWRNRGNREVTITLRVLGDYTGVKKYGYQG